MKQVQRLDYGSRSESILISILYLIVAYLGLQSKEGKAEGDHMSIPDCNMKMFCSQDMVEIGF